MNDSHISIVETPDHDDPIFDDDGRRYLSVRSRSRADLTAFFGDRQQEQVMTPDRDYACRAFVPRSLVAEILAERVTATDYDNFKDSLPRPDYTSADWEDSGKRDALITSAKRLGWYSQMWSMGYDLQHGGQLT